MNTLYEFFTCEKKTKNKEIYEHFMARFVNDFKEVMTIFPPQPQLLITNTHTHTLFLGSLWSPST
jgi:hypothetical protein